MSIQQNETNLRKSAYSHEELIQCGKGELFSTGLPRLPLPPMLMFDRFTHLSEIEGKFNRGFMTAELEIKPDLWFFQCHFFHDPVMPGCLGVDALWQMLGFYLGWAGGSGYGRALGAGEVKFFGQVLPSAKLVQYRIDLKRVLRRKLILGIADGELRVDGELIYTCENLKVGLFHRDQMFTKTTEAN